MFDWLAGHSNVPRSSMSTFFKPVVFITCCTKYVVFWNMMWPSSLHSEKAARIALVSSPLGSADLTLQVFAFDVFALESWRYGEPPPRSLAFQAGGAQLRSIIHWFASAPLTVGKTVIAAAAKRRLKCMAGKLCTEVTIVIYET